MAKGYSHDGGTIDTVGWVEAFYRYVIIKIHALVINKRWSVLFGRRCPNICDPGMVY